MESGNYQLALRQEFHARKHRNAAYSLRAFARALGVSHAGLSQVMSGKRPLTAKSAQKMARALGWSPARLQALLAQSESHHRELEAETFEVIATWYHYVILSLLELPPQKPLSAWIARRLGIPQPEARRALARLARLGLIERHQGKWRQAGKQLMTSQDVASTALRAYYRQNLRRAEETLDSVPLLERDFSSLTMAIDPEQLPAAKAEIKRFRNRLDKLLRTTKPKRVYTMTIQLFPAERGEHETRSME